MHTGHQESPCQEHMLHRQQSEDYFLHRPSGCDGSSAFQRPQVLQPSQAGATRALCSMSALSGISEHPSIKV